MSTAGKVLPSVSPILHAAQMAERESKAGRRKKIGCQWAVSREKPSGLPRCPQGARAAPEEWVGVPASLPPLAPPALFIPRYSHCVEGRPAFLERQCGPLVPPPDFFWNWLG